MNRDYFQQKSKDYEKDKNRVDNVENIANAIKQNIEFNKSMHIIDFGSGTGLLLEKIAPLVGKITAIDVSKSMNIELASKSEYLGCELEILEMDLSESKLEKKFDGIISSMTMHHIKDITTMFLNFYEMLNENGFISIADLDLEDGSFHTEDTGVFHFGFERKEFLNFAKAAGFKNLKIMSASVAQKPQGEYPIFLLIGHK
ncbi:MAG: class I SAM-dependent methyltransferase [Ignavibacteriaceae bacterium]|nr:class I SAM-dependent methyltransferase [Ignavibacteriaceae bacterium]